MKFVIKGLPRAKQSFRFTRSGIKYQDKDVKQWESQCRQQIINQLPENFKPFTNGVVITNLTFVFPYPKTLTKAKKEYILSGKIMWKQTKPDLMDNLSKNLWDSCSGILFLNDSQIVAHFGIMQKIYGDVPKIEFEINEIKEEYWKTN